MALLTSILFTLVAIFAGVLFVVKRLLTPIIPVKGRTNIPGPTKGIRWPVLGDALWFWNVKDTKDLFVLQSRLCAMREDVLSVYLGSKLIILVLDAKILEEIIKINKCPAKEPEFYQAFNFVSDGVFSKNGKGWSDLRRPLDRLMHMKNMDNFHHVFGEKASILCGKIGDKYGKGEFDLRPLMALCMLDMTLETVFDNPGTQQIKNTYNLPELSDKVVDAVFNNMLQLHSKFKWKWIANLMPLGRTTASIKTELKPIFRSMLDGCLENMKRAGRHPADEDFVPESYLEVALQTAIKENKSEDNLLFSFWDTIIPGFEGASVATSSAILFLAMYPEYQEKAYQEQVEVMGTSIEPPSRDQLSKMNYLDMLFSETLRIVPGPTIVRVVSEQFTVNGYVFPEGASLFIMFHHIFHDPKHWERPEEFYPDHFLPEKVAARPRAAFLPFSFSGRRCPGQMFGICSSKVVLSMLLRRFKFTTRLKFEEMSYKYMLMSESDKGYPVEVTPREIERIN